MAIHNSDKALTYGIALDVCSQWKQENCRSVVSVEDLARIKEWIRTPASRISNFPGMMDLAVKGIDYLIAENSRTSPASANLIRI